MIEEIGTNIKWGQRIQIREEHGVGGGMPGLRGRLLATLMAHQAGSPGIDFSFIGSRGREFEGAGRKTDAPTHAWILLVFAAL